MASLSPPPADRAVVQLRDGQRSREGGGLCPVRGDVYRRVQDGGPRVLVVLTVETALLTSGARSSSGPRPMGAAPSPSETDAPDVVADDRGPHGERS